MKSRAGHTIELDEDEILEATLHHKSYTKNGRTLTGLPKFDDSRDYGISEVQEKLMVQTELKRLIAAAKHPDAYLFSSDGAISTTDGVTFEEVSSIIDQILCNYQIIKHDNARILLENCPSEMERGLKDFTRSRQRLYARYMQDENHVKGCEPAILQPPERNAKLYFAMVDFLTGNIARLVVRTATSKYWETNLFSTLAQWATKLKNLSYDPAHYASLSLSNGEDVIGQTIDQVATKQLFTLKIRIKPDSNEQKEYDTLETEFDIQSQYYWEHTAFRNTLESCLTTVAYSLVKQDSTGERAGCFEACCVVYRSGPAGQTTMLNSDRYGDVSASSDPANITCCFAASDLLLKNVRSIRSGTPETPADENQVIFEWGYSEKDLGPDFTTNFWKTSNIDHVISLVVPLVMTYTYMASHIDSLIHFSSSNTTEEDPIVQFEPPSKHFKALFKMTTAEFLQKKSKRTNEQHDHDIRPVAEYPMKWELKRKYMKRLPIYQVLMDSSGGECVSGFISI